MIKGNFFGKEYRFQTKQGLFSKDKIDAGTELLINSMQIKPTDTVLDLGCGYGVVGIVIANKAKKVYLVDTDIRAVKLTQENININQIKNAQVLISDCLDAVKKIKFDKILTYPPSHAGNEVIDQFITESKYGLKKGGILYLVTMNKLAPYFKRKIKEIFGNVTIIASSASHTVLQSSYA